MPTQLALCLNKYMPTHLSENYIREKILTTNPISQNMKGAQKLDEYIKNLLFDNKKLSTLNLKEKKINEMKGTQEKVTTILGPLTRLWNIMGGEDSNFF